MEQGQEANMEDQERGGGLRALDGNEGGRNAACQEAAKINLIYIILCNIPYFLIFKRFKLLITRTDCLKTKLLDDQSDHNNRMVFLVIVGCI